MRVFHEPCYFAEAVYLLYNFVNRVSYEDEYMRVMRSFGYQFLEKEDDSAIRRVHELTRVSREVTHDLDIEDRRLRYFFERLPGTDQRTGCCLAQVMLVTIPLDCSRVDDFVRQLIEGFRSMEKAGIKINDMNGMGLIVERQDAQEPAEPLSAQLERLPCGVEAKWMILRALTEFETHVRELTELLRPVADRLREAMVRLVEMNEAVLQEWTVYFENHTVDDFQQEMFNTTFLFTQENVPHEIWLCLWNFNLFGTWSEWMLAENSLPVRVAYIGICISFDFAAHKKQKPDEEVLSTMLRALAGKDKLETLRRCMENPISAARLAADMNLNSGTVSRNLYGLFKLGFLETRGDGDRVNYVTKLDSLQQLFGWVVEFVKGV